MKNAVGTIPMAFFHARNCPERSRKFLVFSPAINRKALAHRFSPPGCPGGIEATFSQKQTLFQTAEGR